MITVSCIRCQKDIEIETQPVIGQRLVCPYCQTTAEVLWLYPISLDYPEDHIRNWSGGPSIGEGFPETLEA